MPETLKYFHAICGWYKKAKIWYKFSTNINNGNPTRYPWLNFFQYLFGNL